METWALSRPAARLAFPARTALSHHGAVVRRGHQTTARTKRALKIAPHPYFVTEKNDASHIIFTPSPSIANPYNTPLKFLPKNDPKRRAYLISRFQAAATVEGDALPPPTARAPEKKEYPPMTEEGVREMIRLRQEDPETWTISKLAKEFNCSPMFATITTRKAPREYLEKVQAKLDRIKSRWGPRRSKARADRVKRREMLENGEL